MRDIEDDIIVRVLSQVVCLLNPILDTRISVRLSVRLNFGLSNAQGTPPWILKRGEMENSSQRLLNGQN